MRKQYYIVQSCVAMPSNRSTYNRWLKWQCDRIVIACRVFGRYVPR